MTMTVRPGPAGPMTWAEAVNRAEPPPYYVARPVRGSNILGLSVVPYR
jgi:hypothetical protein